MKKVIIIAEAGVNHNGSISNAKKLIDLAKAAGADFIKFQSFKADNLVTKNAPKAKYQLRNMKNIKDKKQAKMLKKLELTNNEMKLLCQYSKKKKIKFLLSPFDIDGVKLIKSLKLKYIKIPSGEITNLPLLQEIGRNKFKIFMSTGMANNKEISQALNVLTKLGTKKNNIFLLHCNTEYPTPYEDVNLNVLKSFKSNFNIKVGYSDHTIGDHISIGAISMGAEVIEKHITLDKNFKGPDHICSMSPKEFKIFVHKLRQLEKSFGSNKKNLTKSEKKNIKIVRKSIYASETIKKGDKFSKKNLCCKRPFVKISPMQIEKLYGKTANKQYLKDDLIKYKL